MTPVAVVRFAGHQPWPNSAEQTWDMTLPPDPDPEAPFGPFLERIIGEFNGTDNYSGQMESGIATLQNPEYFSKGVYLLAKAMNEGGYRDVYAASSLIIAIYKDGTPQQQTQVRALLPFLITASQRVTDGTDLFMFGLPLVNWQTSERCHV